MTPRSRTAVAGQQPPRLVFFTIVCFALTCLFPRHALAQNTPPVIQVNAGLALNEGNTSTIGPGVLLVTDAEQGAGELTFTVSTAPANGSLSATTFTQYDINNSLVSYTHDGSETTTDYFIFSVSDGAGGTTASTPFIITITPVNDPPFLAVNAGLTLNEGAAAVLGSGALETTDADNSPAQLTYTLTALPSNGGLMLSGSPLSFAGTFTQDDVNSGRLSYAHDGGESTTDAFIFSVTDGWYTYTGNVFNIVITPVNDSPVIETNDGLVLDEGTSATIVSALLMATDAEQGAPLLTYTVVTEPVSGALSLGATFTQADIDANLLIYTHDGGETVSDDFMFTVSDGVGGVAMGTFVITVTPGDDPPLLSNNGLSVVRGGSQTFTRGQLFADDPDTAPVDVLFTVTGPPSAGALVLNGSPGPATFTQDDIDYGRLRYDHDGSGSTTDAFTFDVADQTTTTGPHTFAITVQGTSADPPAITSILDIGNDQGRSVLITFQKCGADTAGSPTPVLEYGAFRRIDPLPSARGVEANGAPSLEGWVFVASVPANGESIYNMVAPTLADSSAEGGIYWSVFFVRALTAEPTTYFDSAPDSGYSVDNLAPGVPLNLAYTSPGILTWDDVPDADFDFYTVYGSASAAFDETAEILGHATAPTFDVQTQGYAHFYVTATDFNGNEGLAAGVENPTGVRGRVPPLEAGISAHPNPFNRSTTIVYTVGEMGPVTVTAYDAAGRRVATLVDNEYREPDVYRIEFRPRVASGVYFVEIRTLGGSKVARAVLLK